MHACSLAEKPFQHPVTALKNRHGVGFLEDSYIVFLLVQAIQANRIIHVMILITAKLQAHVRSSCQPVPGIVEAISSCVTYWRNSGVQNPPGTFEASFIKNVSGGEGNRHRIEEALNLMTVSRAYLCMRNNKPANRQKVYRLLK